MSLVEKYVYNLSDVIALVDFFPSSAVLLKNFGMSSKKSASAEFKMLV